MRHTLIAAAPAMLAGTVLGYGVPNNLQQFYDRVKGPSSDGTKCPSGTTLKDGFTSKQDGSSGMYSTNSMTYLLS